MVINNNSLDEQIHGAIAKMRTELNALEFQRQQLNDRLVELVRAIEAYELVLEYESRKAGREYSTGPDWGQLLQGLKRKDQIIVIAKQKGGRFKVGDARDILFNSGISQSRSRKSAYFTTYGLVKEMENDGLLEKVGPAEFQIPKPPQLSLLGTQEPPF